MTAWEETTFSDLGQCIRGVSYKPHNLREASGTNTVTLLRSNNIRDGRLNFHDVQYVEAHMVRPEQHLKHSDIAVCMSNGNRALVGKAGQFDEASITTAYTVGAFCSIFRPTADYESDFVRYQFSSPLYQQQLDSLLAGSAINNLKGSDVSALKALVPTCRHEQSKIAEVLSTVDLAIEDTEALIAKQQRIKTGLMQDLLTRGIDEHGNLRSEHTHEFKDSPLGRIPVEWEVMTLGAMLKRARGNLQTGPFGSQLHAHEYVHEGTPVIMPQDILNGQISTSLIARIPEWRANELRRHRLLPNDIVFSRRGDLSRASGIGEREAGWICGTGCFLLRVSADTIDSTWLANVYRHHNVQRQVDTNAVGSTMPSLNNAVMENLTIAFPKADERKEIMRRCDAADDGIASTVDQLAKMRALKRGLMQDLLTGNRRVTPLLEQREAVTT